MKLYQSEQINDLAAALSRAQGEFPKIPKTKTVDFVNKSGQRTYYRYADLSDIIDSIKPVMSKHGLSYSQDIVQEEETGKLLLWTSLMHSSGQWKKGSFPLTLGGKPQETGSNITYIRRYTLCAALGIQADEDNDAQFIEAKETPKGQKGSEPTDDSPPFDEPPHPDHHLLAHEISQIQELVKDELKWTSEEFKIVLRQLGITNFKVMPKHKYSNLMDYLTEKAFKGRRAPQ